MPHEYGGRMLAPGDEFECHEEFVNLIKLLGRAIEVEAPAVQAPEPERKAYKRARY